MAYKIIALDGGGIRGLISAALLSKLDGHCGLVKKTDLFAGTASGSLLALALAHGINVGHVISLFEQKGEHIFDPAAMDFNCSTPFTFEQITALNNSSTNGVNSNGETIKSIFQAKFRADNLKDELGRLFGASRLNELPRSGPQVMVEAMQLWSAEEGRWSPASIGSGRNDPFAAMLAMDAALCSSATPTLFPPHKPEEPAGENWGYFASGNVHANNPSVSAANYAAKHFGAEMSEIRVLSLGAGRVHAGIPPQDIGRAECWGAWQWMRPYPKHGGTVPAAPLLETAIDASSLMCEQFAKVLLGDRYIRANVELDAPWAPNDWAKTDALQGAVEEFAKTDCGKSLFDLVAEHWELEDNLALPAKSALSNKNRNWFSTLFS
ncbi:patatin-like phospholipase family protein [Pontixanthobacter gangjinensis]|uniref:PNPLA domain-containing protein n=1 Tax=Pontixanthobacter gangjinensis TaxID=1028742 RepID=A0A6I4SM45_9SPHN|nr:patatin-like phospholipase family protein [Pontixanthobacter gangjinensis]MXO56783.1 hypothetical protein [Pontixanthobacter gangjinensis]